MKTYNELTEAQQAAAVSYVLGRLLEAILNGGIRFNDELNQDDLQARIDVANAKADAMQTLWFAHEYILDTCRDDLTSMAQCTAEEALYAEAEYVVPIARLEVAHAK